MEGASNGSLEVKSHSLTTLLCTTITMAIVTAALPHPATPHSPNKVKVNSNPPFRAPLISRQLERCAAKQRGTAPPRRYTAESEEQTRASHSLSVDGRFGTALPALPLPPPLNTPCHPFSIAGFVVSFPGEHARAAWHWGPFVLRLEYSTTRHSCCGRVYKPRRHYQNRRECRWPAKIRCNKPRMRPRLMASETKLLGGHRGIWDDVSGFVSLVLLTLYVKLKFSAKTRN